MGYKLFGIKNHSMCRQKPTRKDLHGFSPSEFKTKLKRAGFKVPKTFFKNGGIAIRNGRRFRFRWWSGEGFVVDIGESVRDFDRWANSTVEVIDFEYFIDHINECDFGVGKIHPV